MVLIFGGPLAGLIVAGFASTSGHLRASGGLAFAAIALFASFGLFQAIEVIRTNGVVVDGAWVLAMPGAGLGAAAMTAFALYRLERGPLRRMLFLASGLIWPISIWPVISLAVIYLIPGWIVCFTLVLRDPPLRTNEPDRQATSCAWASARKRR
jgi:hypothetical protein